MIFIFLAYRLKRDTQARFGPWVIVCMPLFLEK